MTRTRDSARAKNRICDYQDFLNGCGTPFDRLSTRGSDVTWNIFREIKKDSDADEVARAIFADTDESEYFDVAARQVFAAVLKLIQRNYAEVDETPSNYNLINFFERKGRSDVYEDLLGEDDLTGAASHLDPESSKQASGVYAAVQRQINDVFIGDFAAEGTFSVREYMKTPEGKAVVLDYPYREGQSTKPIFRLLIDLAAREALDDSDRGSYFVLDEVAQIPHLSRLGELVNVGAGRSIQVLLTLQSVAQLRANYGRERDRARSAVRECRRFGRARRHTRGRRAGRSGSGRCRCRHARSRAGSGPGPRRRASRQR